MSNANVDTSRADGGADCADGTITEPNEDRVAILVAGVARSGTSALSGVLAESGVHVIHDEGMRSGRNPLGFFEHGEITTMSAALQSVIGAAAHSPDFQADIGFLDYDWTTLPGVQSIADWLAVVIEAEANGAPLIGVKRETICRHFPLFEAVLRRLGYSVRVLMPWRDPYEVATSIGDAAGITVPHALLLWASYVIDAERFTRHVPRAWTYYGELVGSQKLVVERALRKIGVPLTVPSEGFATPALRRSRPAPCDGVYRPLLLLVADVVYAISQESPAETWDHLRERLAEICGFIQEVNQSLIPTDGTGEEVAKFRAHYLGEEPPTVSEYRATYDRIRPGDFPFFEAQADTALAAAEARAAG